MRAIELKTYELDPNATTNRFRTSHNNLDSWSGEAWRATEGNRAAIVRVDRVLEETVTRHHIGNSQRAAALVVSDKSTSPVLQICIPVTHQPMPRREMSNHFLFLVRVVALTGEESLLFRDPSPPTRLGRS